MHRVLTIGLLLALATVAVYGQVGGFDFVHIDDTEYVVENPHLDEVLDAGDVAWALTTFHFSNWHPLTWVSYQLDAALFGKQNASAYHLVNLAWHVLGTWLCFGALRALTGRELESGLVAAAFALHPLHVESVAWISERKDVLAGAAWWATTWAWACYVRSRARPRAAYGLALLGFSLGLMAKPLLVTLPCTLLLLDYWPLRRPFSMRLVVEKLPFFALSALSSVLTYLAQQQSGAVVALDRLSLFERVANACLAYVRYAALSFWPTDLAVFYPHPGMAGQPPMTLPQIAGAALLLAAITAAAGWAARRGQRMGLVGWLWFLGTLVPMIGLVQVGFAAIADRYTYVPLVGLALAVIFGAGELVRARPALRWAALALGVVVCAAWAVKAHERAAQWRDTRALFDSALAVTRNNGFIHYNYGHWLQQQGEIEAAKHHYRRAWDINRRRTEAGVNLGALLFLGGQREEGLAMLEEAVRIRPGNAEANYNLGLALQQSGQTGRAEYAFRQVLVARPAAEPPIAARSHGALAVLARARGDLEAAARHAEASRALLAGEAQAGGS